MRKNLNRTIFDASRSTVSMFKNRFMDKTNHPKIPGIAIWLSYVKPILCGRILAVMAILSIYGCQKKDVTIFCIGDSTMAYYDTSQLAEKYGGQNYPLRGWAMELAGFLDEHAVVENMAISGISSKNFRTGGHWEKVKNQFRKGDFLIIQFGHNDEKKDDPNRYTKPMGEFRDNLRKYAREAMEEGVHPILATSIARRKFHDNGSLIDTHGDYVLAPREVAAELNIPLVDLHSLTMDYIRKQGREESKKLFLHIAPGDYKNLPDGRLDNTHLSKEGAHAVSSLFVKGLKKTRSTLKDYIIN